MYRREHVGGPGSRDKGGATQVLASRATDMAGNVQPQQREENVGGYNNASWNDHAVTVTVA